MCSIGFPKILDPNKTLSSLQLFEGEYNFIRISKNYNLIHIYNDLQQNIAFCKRNWVYLRNFIHQSANQASIETLQTSLKYQQTKIISFRPKSRFLMCKSFFLSTLDVMNWEDIKKRVKSALNSDFLCNLQVGYTNCLLKLPLIDHLAKIDSCKLFNQRLNSIQKWKGLFVQSHQETYSSIFLKNFLRKHQSLDVVGHEHKRKAKKYGAKFPVTYNIFYIIKIALMNLYSRVIFEKLLSFFCILRMQVYTDYFSVICLQLLSDFFEWSPCAASDIEKVSFLHSHEVHHLNMSRDSQESADKQIINEDWYFFDKSQHFYKQVCRMIQIFISKSEPYCESIINRILFDLVFYDQLIAQLKIIFSAFQERMSKNKRDIENELKKNILEAELQRSLQLRRKIVNKQLDKIQSMSLSQLIERQRRPKPVTPIDHTKSYLSGELNKSLSESGFQSSLQNPGQKHAQLFKQTEQRIKEYRRQLKKNPVMAQVKRGKLGIDNVFVIFAVIGFALLPVYFGKKIKNNQEKIVQSRGVDPRVIQNLDEESNISLDSVSQQSIHYLNNQRQDEIKKKLKMHNKISELKRQLDL